MPNWNYWIMKVEILSQFTGRSKRKEGREGGRK